MVGATSGVSKATIAPSVPSVTTQASHTPIIITLLSPPPSIYCASLSLHLSPCLSLRPCHTSADACRPALQIIKGVQGSSVSSIFFMLLPNEVLIFTLDWFQLAVFFLKKHCV